MRLEDGQREAGRLPGISAADGVGVPVRDITAEGSRISRAENTDLRPDVKPNLAGQYHEQSSLLVA